MSKLRLLVILAALTVAVAPAQAQSESTSGSSSSSSRIQTQGPQVWPGKFLFGVRPIGGEVGFNPTTGESGAIFKLGLDFAGRFLSREKASFWLGGELNVGGVAYLAMIEPGFFFRVTLERLVNIPLVPYVQVGVAGQMFSFYGSSLYNRDLFGAALFKAGGGLHYFLTKNIGLGFHTTFGVGVGIDNRLRDNLYFSGFWDMGLGAQFAF